MHCRTIFRRGIERQFLSELQHSITAQIRLFDGEWFRSAGDPLLFLRETTEFEPLFSTPVDDPKPSLLEYYSKRLPMFQPRDVESFYAPERTGTIRVFEDTRFYYDWKGNLAFSISGAKRKLCFRFDRECVVALYNMSEIGTARGNRFVLRADNGIDCIQQNNDIGTWFRTTETWFFNQTENSTDMCAVDDDLDASEACHTVEDAVVWPEPVKIAKCLYPMTKDTFDIADNCLDCLKSKEKVDDKEDRKDTLSFVSAERNTVLLDVLRAKNKKKKYDADRVLAPESFVTFMYHENGARTFYMAHTTFDKDGKLWQPVSFFDFPTSFASVFRDMIANKKNRLIGYKKALLTSSCSSSCSSSSSSFSCCTAANVLRDIPCIVTLAIDNAVICAQTRVNKCRANRARVMCIEELNACSEIVLGDDGQPVLHPSAVSMHDRSFRYDVGNDVFVLNFEDNNVECAAGIHFFFEKNAAINY